ncbi:hypothetical protein F4861DRAFT_236840 [Xylaria intraflava]|nr:hypothetical protein F4861DRAFT_236840 [Xylaria intraflava]
MCRYPITLALMRAFLPAGAARLRGRNTDKHRRNILRHDADLSSGPRHLEQRAFNNDSPSPLEHIERYCHHPDCNGPDGRDEGDGEDDNDPDENNGGDTNPGALSTSSQISLSPHVMYAPTGSASFTPTSTSPTTLANSDDSTDTSSVQPTDIGAVSSTPTSPSSSTPTDSPVSPFSVDDSPSLQQHKTKDQISPGSLAGAIIGAVVAVLLIFAAWYLFVSRRKRRERNGTQNAAVLPKNIDLESHDTEGLRSGSYTPYSRPYDGTSSVDGLAHARPVIPLTTPGPVSIVVDGTIHADLYIATHRSSLAGSQASFVDGYRTSRMTHDTDHSRSASPRQSVQGSMKASLADGYRTSRTIHNPDHSRSASPRRSAQGPMTAISPPLSRPSPLQTATSRPASIPNQTPMMTTGLDDGPPPRYPDVTTPSPEGSPTSSPLTVSPLSAISSHAYSLNSQTHSTAGAGAPYHTQTHQYQAPRQSSYKGRESPDPAQVVSPMYQLGQTAASQLEYCESAGMAMHSDQGRVRPSEKGASSSSLVINK